jgi:hypothetical protein
LSKPILHDEHGISDGHTKNILVKEGMLIMYN